jgi:hypothetical protein
MLPTTNAWDSDAEAYVQKHLRGSRMEIMWNALPTGILVRCSVSYTQCFANLRAEI